MNELRPYITAGEEQIVGSTVAHLSDKDMKALYVLVPKETKYFAPRKTLDAIMNQMIESKQQIHSLRSLRDELLPLLMNGQVEVK